MRLRTAPDWLRVEDCAQATASVTKGREHPAQGAGRWCCLRLSRPGYAAMPNRRASRNAYFISSQEKIPELRRRGLLVASPRMPFPTAPLTGR